MLAQVERIRLRISKGTDPKKKSQLGQFFTPASVAMFMAKLFTANGGECRLLDAGAGIGSLSSAFLDRCIGKEINFSRVHLLAYELDETIHGELRGILEKYESVLPFSFEVIPNDFLEAAVNGIQFNQFRFTHAILNPPYKKINSRSRHRLLLRQVGIETVNLYSAFIALSLLLLESGGQLAAIVPRSFCNGPYYRPFREFLMGNAAIRHIHLFESRTEAFKDDKVLQENIIILLERGVRQHSVNVSISRDDSFDDIDAIEYPFDRIVFPDDPEKFIHVPTAPGISEIEISRSVNSTLSELGIKVSTGPVVDFRASKHLCKMPEADTVPLLYPAHFRDNRTAWPNAKIKKPNAIKLNQDTQKWLYNNGYYCVVRRFSSKEEKRRITASVVEPSSFKGAPFIGFENHLNVFHRNKKGLPKTLAYGLAVYLNTTALDSFIRRFNGHTQVNATDLKTIKYPCLKRLNRLGEWAISQGNLDQKSIDDIFGKADHEKEEKEHRGRKTNHSVVRFAEGAAK